MVFRPGPRIFDNWELRRWGWCWCCCSDRVQYVCVMGGGWLRLTSARGWGKLDVQCGSIPCVYQIISHWVTTATMRAPWDCEGSRLGCGESFGLLYAHLCGPSYSFGAAILWLRWTPPSLMNAPLRPLRDSPGFGAQHEAHTLLSVRTEACWSEACIKSRRWHLHHRSWPRLSAH